LSRFLDEARLPSPLQRVEDERLARHGVVLSLKRDDLIHPQIIGNKWRKLLPNLRAAADAEQHTLLTFGGAYSNHLRATATAGRLLDFATIGMVRGQELAGRPLNDSLARAAADGMRLHFVDRATYRRKAEPDAIAELARRFGRFHLIPEGGSNALAARGCAALGEELRGHADVVAVACGTGGTLAGLAAGLAAGQDAEQDAGLNTDGPRAIGFPALRGGAFLEGEIERLQQAAFSGRRGRWRLETRFHFGGYGRTTPELTAFAADLARRHGIAPDPVYVAKMLYGVYALVEEGAFAPGTRIAAVVTG
jgi:1-aminocyclopropane-1-carboxylate deaminase